MNSRRLLICLAMAVLGLCGPASGAPAPAPDAPSAVIRSFYETLNRGDQEAADAYYSSEYRAHNLNFPTDLQEYTMLGMIGTAGHTITGIATSNEKVEGDRAWVDVVLRYRSGDALGYRVGLLREEGRWKITWLKVP